MKIFLFLKKFYENFFVLKKFFFVIFLFLKKFYENFFVMRKNFHVAQILKSQFGSKKQFII